MQYSNDFHVGTEEGEGSTRDLDEFRVLGIMDI